MALRVHSGITSFSRCSNKGGNGGECDPILMETLMNILMESGANLDLIDIDGMTALHHAALNNNQECMIFNLICTTINL